MNSDDCQTRTVALQDSNHQSEDDGSKFFVEKRLRFTTDGDDVGAGVEKCVVGDAEI